MSPSMQRFMLALAAEGGMVESPSLNSTAHALADLGAIRAKYWPKRGCYRVTVTELGRLIVAGIRAVGGVA